MWKSMKRRKKPLFLSIFLSLFVFQLHNNYPVELHLTPSHGKDLVITMPRKDRDSLYDLFYLIMIRDCGGYTLFGNKPMHMNCFYQPILLTKWEHFLNSIHPSHLRTYKGWKTWLKYRHFFEKSNFIFWEEKNPFWEKIHKENNPVISIFFSNKKKMEEIIQANLKDFQKVLKNPHITSADVLKLDHKLSFFNDNLQGHEGLIGTLFGYGKENASAFEERANGKDTNLRNIWEDENAVVYEHYQKRPYWLWAFLGICSSDFSSVLGYPFFLADPNSLETKRLK